MALHVLLQQARGIFEKLSNDGNTVRSASPVNQALQENEYDLRIRRPVQDIGNLDPATSSDISWLRCERTLQLSKGALPAGSVVMQRCTAHLCVLKIPGIRSSTLSVLIEAFLDDSGQVDEQVVTLSAVGRAVHHCKQFRLQIRQQAQDSLGLAGVWHVTGQRSLLQLLHRFPRRLDQIRAGDGLDVAEMMKQVGTKQHKSRAGKGRGQFR
jgi:hypothetical protein